MFMLSFDATVGVVDNPLLGLRPQDMRAEPAGRTIAEVAPITDKPVVCQVSGIPGYIPREQWGYKLQPQDIVVFTIDPPESDGTVRGVLAVVVAAAYIAATSGFGALTFGGAVVAVGVGLTVSNLLLPPTLPESQNQQAANAVFSTSLSGNQAKLDQPIWKVCGRRKITPPFACEPYLEFAETDTGFDCDQFYYALFAVGEGNHDLEQALIGGTPIGHYDDVIVSQYLPPGTPPSQVLANVSNCPAVSGSLLDSGRYVGGFAACKPKRTCAAIGIDIVATRGLGKGTSPLTVSWRVESRTIDDFGVATSVWSTLGSGTKTGATNTPQRWSQKFVLSTPARIEVRVVRTDPKDPDSTAAHEITWAGLRAYTNEPAPLNANTAHYEVVLRASDQLSQLSQRDIALIVTGKCRTWTPGGGWGSEVATRNGMLWLMDLLSKSTWGGGYADDRIDLQSFYDISLTANLRQDRFDWVFDTAMPLWDAAQLIARSCRSRVFRRNGVYTIARDELATLPVTAFTHRNCMPGSMVISEKLPTNDTPDGYVIEYEDNRTWLKTPIECPCPGVTVMTNPVRKFIEGVTGATQARREGMYEAANLTYRPRTTTCKTEMQGVLPAFMSAVRWMPEIYGYGQSGDVAYWDPANLVLGLTEPPVFGAASLYLTMQKDDGTLTTPVAVTPGPTNYDITLPAAPDFDLVIDDGTRERPKYLLGPQVGGDELVKVLAIRDGGRGQEGEQLYDVDGVIDDERVHTADNAYLPGPGDIQDPIVIGSDVIDPGSGVLYIANLSSHYIRTYYSGANSFSLRNDGNAIRGDDSGSHAYPTEWMLYGIVEPTVAALYEVYATFLGGMPGYGGNPIAVTTNPGNIGVWLNLGTNRTWSITQAAPNGSQARYGTAYFRLDIRKVGETTILASATISMLAGTV
jgi:hypothetical protein